MADSIILSTDFKDSIDMLTRMSYDKIVKKGDVRKEVRKALTPVRKAVSNAAKAAMSNDPRGAYKAVKIVTYRDGNGGNVSILNKRGGVKKMGVFKSERGGVSGIRRKRDVSERTKQVRGYIGSDRALILRFVNSGTTTRTALSSNKKPSNRGMISAKNFFASAGGAMSQASGVLAKSVERIISEASKD